MKRLDYHIPLDGPIEDEWAVFIHRLDWAIAVAVAVPSIYVCVPAMARILFH